ncbi:MAG: AAA family ATPase [Acidimicrobiales bacterium]
MTPEECADHANNIARQVARVIVGQRELIEDVLLCLLAEGARPVGGVPGLGKTQLLKTLAETLDLPWSRIQFTPDLMPADIVGTQILQQSEDGHRELQFRPGPITANLVLADEVNPSHTEAQAAMGGSDAGTCWSPWPAKPGRCPDRSWSWPRRTRSRWREPIRCPRPSSTASSSRRWCRSPLRGSGDGDRAHDRGHCSSPEQVCDAETLRSMIADPRYPCPTTWYVTPSTWSSPRIPASRRLRSGFVATFVSVPRLEDPGHDPRWQGSGDPRRPTVGFDR